MERCSVASVRGRLHPPLGRSAFASKTFVTVCTVAALRYTSAHGHRLAARILPEPSSHDGADSVAGSPCLQGWRQNVCRCRARAGGELPFAEILARGFCHARRTSRSDSGAIPGTRALDRHRARGFAPARGDKAASRGSASPPLGGSAEEDSIRAFCTPHGAQNQACANAAASLRPQPPALAQKSLTQARPWPIHAS